jgi:uncharacterized protein (DUF1330 family)
VRGYAVAHIRDVAVNADIVRYLEQIDATLAAFGGRFVIHGGVVERIEGTWPGHVVLIAFPDRDRARAWYRSPAYQSIVHLRTDNSHADVVLVDGVDEGHRATDILADRADSTDAAATR